MNKPVKVDNDVTLKKAKEIIKNTEKFINYQRKANGEFAKVIQFTKISDIKGLYEKSKITVNLCNNGNDMLESLFAAN